MVKGHKASDMGKWKLSKTAMQLQFKKKRKANGNVAVFMKEAPQRKISCGSCP